MPLELASVNDLPKELSSLIFSSLTLQELGRANGVSKSWKQASDSDAIWEIVLKNLWAKGDHSIDSVHFAGRHIGTRQYFSSHSNLSGLDQTIAIRSTFSHYIKKGHYPSGVTSLLLNRTDFSLKSLNRNVRDSFLWYQWVTYKPNHEPVFTMVLWHTPLREECDRAINALSRWLLAKHPELKMTWKNETLPEAIGFVIDVKGRLSLKKLAQWLTFRNHYAFPWPLTYLTQIPSWQISFPKGTIKDEQGTVDVEVLEKATNALEKAKRNPTTLFLIHSGAWDYIRKDCFVNNLTIFFVVWPILTIIKQIFQKENPALEAFAMTVNVAIAISLMHLVGRIFLRIYQAGL